MGDDEFEYDLLGRITNASVVGWLQDFRYDPFGSITRIRTTPLGQGQSTLPINVTSSTNRLTSSAYDGSGNMTVFNNANPPWSQEYDPLNMPTERTNLPNDPNPSAWAAIYTASDERIATWDESSGALEEHWTLRSPDGKILRDFRFGPPIIGELIFCDGFETGNTSAWSSIMGLTGAASGETSGTSCLGEAEWTVHASYVHRGGALLADYNAGEARHYHLDHLGSVRQITTSEGDVAESRDYLPYGREISDNGGALQFTGHERDSHLAGHVEDPSRVSWKLKMA
jgi:uncharacterized protein RhaS with RHS repeats